MILNALTRHGWHYAETLEAQLQLASQLLETLPPESSTGRFRDPGGDAVFSFSDRIHDDVTELPTNFLRVGLNSKTGYGALIWFVSERDPRKGGIYEQTWISDNPSPPARDPRVVSDPGGPRFHHLRSTLPRARVQAAIDEFCRTGTGDRPACVDWVIGHPSGRRQDEPHIDYPPAVDDPWA
ncbi:hypothetical protein Afil01_32120 [Actinorhabdospora filicis]|uniref:Immunity protein Imm1 n=1 Tax=Actinorhabdospora filicis TaxID=1785913 RepID=A0A9W6SM35_9ACTN|nr:hypothetical protein Afil01_32120 [Actinorhabdospora filicis]